MAYARDCSDEEIDHALEAAGVEFVTQLSEGIDTMVGDRVMLSGGQGTISLARALLNDRFVDSR